MLFLMFVAFLVALVLAKRFAFGAFFISASVFAMAGCAAAGGLFTNPDGPVSLRFVTLDESPLVAAQAGPLKRSPDAPFELTAAGYRAKSISIQVHRNDLAELREHIKYELRRGNIAAERATTLNHLVNGIDLEAMVGLPARQAIAHQERALVELTHAQAKLSEMLADTTNLVEALSSVRIPEFAGTFIAAKIQAVRLQAEKAGVDGSIDEIRESLKRPKAG